MEIDKIEVHNAKTGKFVTTLHGLKSTSTIHDVKKAINIQKKIMTPGRQEVRLEQKGKGLNDDDTLNKCSISNGSKIFVKDLGPQIAWSTVFIAEYAGPLVIYLWVYQRPWLFYGVTTAAQPYSLCAHIAAGCYSFHYVKRLLETKFVHRFSKGSMPILNLIKNCSYYWGFTAYVAYHINHPLFTPPSDRQTYLSLVAFLLCELGNFSIHLALRNLRPAGTKERKIPVPTSNPLTGLFDFVSCPNYTYEVGSWVAFTIMTQCLPAGIFAFCGFYQMMVWALGKHKNYKKEFTSYPKNRKSIIPFII